MTIRARIEAALTTSAVPFQWLTRPTSQPCATYEIFDTSTPTYGAGAARHRTYYIGIDVFSPTDYDAQVTAVRSAMEAAGFRLYNGPSDDWDYDAKLYRATVQYTYTEAV